MKILILIFIFIPLKSFALEAVVTVLETPLLRTPSKYAPVVQYLRKGDIIKIHPSVGNPSLFEHYRPDPEKLKSIQEELNLKENETYSIDQEFIPLVDRSGSIAYVLKEHIYVYFDNSQEYSQANSFKDETDYRLEEPLPKNYPLKLKNQVRGLFTLGFTQPFSESYPYRRDIKAKGYGTPIELQVSLMKEPRKNYWGRFFYGGTFTFKSLSNNYLFIDQRSSQEKIQKFGLGPVVGYDAFKGEKHRFNIAGSLLFHPLDRLNIEQKRNSIIDRRTYSSYSFSSRLTMQYHRKKILPESNLDFIFGTSLEFGLPTTYKAQNGGAQEDWWKSLGDDQFTLNTTFHFGGHIGLQSAY